MADREKIIERIKHYQRLTSLQCLSFPNERTEFHGTMAAVLELLKSQPDVVRCKDCKWWEPKGEGCRYGYCHACKHGYHSQHWEIEIYRTYPFDWFCADGERKDE